MELLAETHPVMEYDLHEVAPAETLELLYARTVNIGLIAAQSVAQSSFSFHRLPVIEDPYILAVPSSIDLSAVEDPNRDLPPEHRAVVHSCIQFNFGTQHTNRVSHWYQTMLPGHRLVTQCRTYDVALSIVQAGKGVCLAPSLTAYDGGDGMAGVSLYATDQTPRQTIAVLPAHYLRVEPYKTFLSCLQQAGREVRFPKVLPVPPFIRRAAEGKGKLSAG